MSDWLECAGCHTRFYVGFIPPERWKYKGPDGELYCSPECRKLHMDREKYRALRRREMADDARRLEDARDVIAEGTDRIAEETARAAVKVKAKRLTTHERTEMRKAAGLCVACGRKNDNPYGTYCFACANKNRKRAAEQRERKHGSGLCETCGKPVEPDENGKRKAYCAVCRDRRNEAARKRYADARERKVCEDGT